MIVMNESKCVVAAAPPQHAVAHRFSVLPLYRLQNCRSPAHDFEAGERRSTLLLYGRRVTPEGFTCSLSSCLHPDHCSSLRASETQLASKLSWISLIRTTVKMLVLQNACCFEALSQQHWQDSDRYTHTCSSQPDLLSLLQCP